MKKLVALLSIILVCSLIVSASADIDLSAMNIDELLALEQQVTEAIFANNGTTILQPGDYVVGKDIPSGSYIIRFFENKDDHTYGKITIYASLDAMKSYKSDLADYKLQVQIIEANSKNGFEVPLADRPAKFEEGNYITFYTNERFAVGTTYHVVLEEGQVLHLETNANEMIATIEKVKMLLFE